VIHDISDEYYVIQYILQLSHQNLTEIFLSIECRLAKITTDDQLLDIWLLFFHVLFHRFEKHLHKTR